MKGIKVFIEGQDTPNGKVFINLKMLGGTKATSRRQRKPTQKEIKEIQKQNNKKNKHYIDMDEYSIHSDHNNTLFDKNTTDQIPPQPTVSYFNVVAVSIDDDTVTLNQPPHGENRVFAERVLMDKSTDFLDRSNNSKLNNDNNNNNNNNNVIHAIIVEDTICNQNENKESDFPTSLLNQPTVSSPVTESKQIRIPFNHVYFHVYLEYMYMMS